jgi:hypothetical protein
MRTEQIAALRKQVAVATELIRRSEQTPTKTVAVVRPLRWRERLVALVAGRVSDDAIQMTTEVDVKCPVDDSRS